MYQPKMSVLCILGKYCFYVGQRMKQSIYCPTSIDWIVQKVFSLTVPVRWNARMHVLDILLALR